MTWRPFELFLHPKKEAELMMPPEERSPVPVVYRVRTLLKDRLNVRILNLERTREGRRNMHINLDEGAHELLGKPERVDLSKVELEERWKSYEELEEKMLAFPSELVVADGVELHRRYTI